MKANTLKIPVLLIVAFLLVVCGKKGPTGHFNGDSDGNPDPPQVTLTHPNGGEALADTTTITWSATDPDPGETPLLVLNIDYRSGAKAAWTAIDSNQANDGIYSWDVSGLPDATDYLVRVTAADTTGLLDSDESDAVFAINNASLPRVTVTSPNGGETLTDTVVITWTATDPDPGETALLLVGVEYSADGGNSWITVDSQQANDGSFIWDISGLSAGSNYLVRVTVTDPTGLSNFDVCDDVFTIEGRIFLTDRTGKKWDITHAVKFYDMQPENFNYGLGPFAIQPINSPEMISPGQPGYPSDDGIVRVIGTNINGDARAYATFALSGHEVANDFVGGAYVSVIY